MKIGYRKAGLMLLAVLALGAFGWVVATQGPLAPVKVTATTVQTGTLETRVFGIGVIEAKRSYSLGPTLASRVAKVYVEEGDPVSRGQVLAEIDGVDLDARVNSAVQAGERSAMAVRSAEAQLAEAQSRVKMTVEDEARYQQMRGKDFVTDELLETKHYAAIAAQAALDAASAALEASRRELARGLSDVEAIRQQRERMKLISPVNGVVTARLVESGSTVLAGQAVVQLIDPASVRISARIDQGQAGGIRMGQPVSIVLRSQPGTPISGKVDRLDWISDAVTEERTVLISFDKPPGKVPLGELAEVTIRLARIENARWIPTAALHRERQRQGVWLVKQGSLVFQPVRAGVTTLEGRSQILDGLGAEDQVIVHSMQALRPGLKIKVVPDLVQPQ